MQEYKNEANAGQYALVTGASSGMGLDYCRRLAEMGYSIIMAALDNGLLPQAVEDVKSHCISGSPQEILPIGMDLGQFDSADKLIAQVGDRQVEILINNAGFFKFGSMDTWTEAQVHSMHVLHNVTPVTLCWHYSKMMKERGHGRILNISSLAAWLPYPGITMYSATKCFNRSFSRSLHIELMHTGVTVTAAYFGAVDTSLYKLSDNYRKLARGLGVMITPQKAVEMALKAMFEGKSSCMPGFLNRISLPFLNLPERTLYRLFHKYGGRLS
jgi:short-subunit dehydrogenase